MRYLVLSVASVICLVGCTSGSLIETDQDVRYASLKAPDGRSVQVQVEIADTVELRTLGLMDREELSEGQGMLFVFDQPHVLFFWMKNTLIPLDILFFDEAGNFVSSDTMQPCTAEPCSVYSSGEEALYALEVNAGFGDRYDVGSGWNLEYAP